MGVFRLNLAAYISAHETVFGRRPVVSSPRINTVLINKIVWTEHLDVNDHVYFQVWVESHKEQIRLYDGPSQLFAIEAILKAEMETALEQGLLAASYDLQFEEE